jgi:MinD superfamily P-loop ATPase
VTEPTQSGKEDLLRIIELCKQFRILSFVCINKADINNDISAEIEKLCQENNINFAGRIPYDDTVLTSINELSPITNYENSSANKAIRQIWSNITSVLA